MSQKNNYSYQEVDAEIKASQKLIWFSFGIMAGMAISALITSCLLLAFGLWE